MRTKRERLNDTYNHIKKRLNVLMNKYDWPCYMEEHLDGFKKQPHRLNKNKFEGRHYNSHTKNKTKRNIHGNYQKSRNYKPCDQRQIDAGEYVEN